jgi:hypothetical protein
VIRIRIMIRANKSPSSKPNRGIVRLTLTITLTLLTRPSMKLTEEEEAADKNRIKKVGDVDQVLGRRKNGKG